MNKKDYELIADVLAEAQQVCLNEETATGPVTRTFHTLQAMFCEKLADENENFDAAIFVERADL